MTGRAPITIALFFAAACAPAARMETEPVPVTDTVVTAAMEQLEARKLIERAKGILMRRTGSSEQEAYRIMQRSSQDRSVRMVDIAKAVIDSEPGMKS